MDFQLHFFEWKYTFGGVKPITAADGSPGFYGTYTAGEFFPSPSAGKNSVVEYPAAGANNIAWTGANKNYFSKIASATVDTGLQAGSSDPVIESFLPGSVGPIKFYPADVGPF